MHTRFPSHAKVARLSRKSQITVPIAIRKALGVRLGDKLELRVERDRLLAIPRRSVATITFGALASNQLPLDPAQEHAAFEEAVAGEVAEEERQLGRSPSCRVRSLPDRRHRPGSPLENRSRDPRPT